MSAGDRNTLAIVFFFASLDQDDQIAQKIVIIDDPMTSLDEHRSLTTVQEMRRRLKYRFARKELKVSFGTHPDVSLKEARRRRDEAREMIASGLNPGEQKRILRQAEALSTANTLTLIGEEYLDMAAREGREAVTVAKSRWLLSLMAGDIGERPISEISAPELLRALKKVEAKGHLETARRMRSLAGRIFHHAIATARATNDPSVQLKGALIAPRVVHHNALLDEASVGS